MEYGIDEFIEAEAQAQAICMQTQDFARAYHAFVAKENPFSREIRAQIVTSVQTLQLHGGRVVGLQKFLYFKTGNDAILYHPFSRHHDPVSTVGTA